MSKFFRLPWATAGDKTSIPDPTQVSGDVSYNQGYPPDYELDQSDPNAKNVERQKYNQVLFDITENLKFWQTFGVYDFITPAMNDGVPFAYDQGARVLFSGSIYRSLISLNIQNPTDPASWVLESKEYIAELLIAGKENWYLRAKSDLSGFELIDPFLQSVMPFDSKNGLDISNSGVDSDHDIIVSSGSIMDSTNLFRINLSASLTKQIDNTFAVGDNAGGFSDQSTLSNDTWYRVFIISKENGSSEVIIASDESDALNDTVVFANNYIYARRIGWVYADGSQNILPWVSGNNGFYRWTQMIAGPFVTGTSRNSYNVFAPPNQVCSLASTVSIGILGIPVNATVYVLFTQLDQTDEVPSFSMSHISSVLASGVNLTTPNSIALEIKTNSNSEIGIRKSAASNVQLAVYSMGWKDDLRIP